MSLADLEFSLPETDGGAVRAMHQTARFYKDENGRDMVEIGYVGMKDTNVSKVKPEHMARFRDEWNAFCDGSPLKIRTGMPLTDVPGVNDLVAENFVKQNIHNAEELAALNDGQCQALGHGALTARNNARKLIETEAERRREKLIQQMGKATSKLGAAPAEASADVVVLKAEVSELKNMVGDLVKALADKPKRGRPPKAE